MKPSKAEPSAWQRLVGERIRELQVQRAVIKDKLEEIKAQRSIPLHLFRDDAITPFQGMVREMFLSEDRLAAKAYLKIFIEKIEIDLPRIDISCKTSVLLAAMDNRTAVKTGDALTADVFWLTQKKDDGQWEEHLFLP